VRLRDESRRADNPLFMKISVPTETAPREQRVALAPDSAARLIKQLKLEIAVQRGAGLRAGFRDEAYQSVGASIVPDAGAAFDAAIIAKVQPPSADEIARMPQGATLISLMRPGQSADSVTALAQRGVTSLALELVPRITRAQSMDVLSSQSTVAGYKGVLIGASALGKFLPMLTTAAGNISPAKVFVIGAGVAGLQAIATARRLGAVVEGYDIRPAVKEEVESLGATFVGPTLSKEETQDAQGYAKALSTEARAKAQELLRARIPQADVIITTARVPGTSAPKLISAEDVRKMKPGSVIVDLAADQGGNCEPTKAGVDTVVDGVTILGPVRLEGTLPVHASQMYSRNITAFFLLMVKEGALNLNFQDDIVRDTCVTHEGVVRHAPTAERLGVAAPAPVGNPA
jgi:H+-translocating NAD(P) transhydrogenase subunit alpha